VYIFEGSDVVADDEGSATSPITSSLLDDQYQYEIGFINAGDYTLALTCTADLDDPELDDDIVFVQSANVTIENKQTTSLNIE